jgi:hypothetical protein
VLEPGDVLQYSWAGGGGYGDPRDRGRADLPALRLDGGAFACRCGQRLGAASSGWRAGTRTRRLERARLHERLELVEYACPSCGTRHAVDVQERDAEPVEDMVLA